MIVAAFAREQDDISYVLVKHSWASDPTALQLLHCLPSDLYKISPSVALTCDSELNAGRILTKMSCCLTFSHFSATLVLHMGKQLTDAAASCVQGACRTTDSSSQQLQTRI